jgi:ribosomal RNA-processing protein 12
MYAGDLFTFNISNLLLFFLETMPLDILEQNVSNMCLLLASPSREIVQACLSFVKGVVTLYPVAVLGNCVNKIINGIVSLTPDCSRKFRLKTKSILARLMRKFGDDYITSETNAHLYGACHYDICNVKRTSTTSIND